MTSAQTLDIAAILDLEQGPDDADVAFFTDIARRTGGPVLDLGCGVGRLALPIARAGIDVTALDILEPVLARFRKKLTAEPRRSRERIRLVQADMRRFAMRGNFRAAICSSNTLFLLGSEDSIAEALECVRAHLAPGGRLIIDAAAIDAEARAALAEYPAGDFPDLDLSDGTGDHLLHRTHSIKARKGDEHGMEPSSETNRFSIKYKYFDDSGGLRGERREDVVLLTPEELLHLLCDSGYEIEDTFGWYDRRTFSEGDRKMIVLARKKE